MFLMCEGTWFQIFGPQTEKVRFPNWGRILTSTAALIVAERSCRRPESPLLSFFHNVAEIYATEYATESLLVVW